MKVFEEKLGDYMKDEANLLKLYCERILFEICLNKFLKRVERERYGKKFKVKGRIGFDVLLINFFFLSITIICI